MDEKNRDDRNKDDKRPPAFYPSTLTIRFEGLDSLNCDKKREKAEEP